MIKATSEDSKDLSVHVLLPLQLVYSCSCVIPCALAYVALFILPH